MSKKAEEAANKDFEGRFNTDDQTVIWFMDKMKHSYIRAYEQAEKDLSLTIEDIERIHTFLYAVKNNKQGAFTFTRLSDEQYEEVLRRFNKSKEGKQ